jgi:hypothetical protein
MRKIAQGAGLYLAVLELVVALGWTGAEGKTTGVLFSALAELSASYARRTSA